MDNILMKEQERMNRQSDNSLEQIKIPILILHQCSDDCAFKYKQKQEFTNQCKRFVGLSKSKKYSFVSVPNKSYVNGRCDKYGSAEENDIFISRFDIKNHHLSYPDEIVIKDNWYIMTINYPLNKPLTRKYESEKGFTMIEIINNIIETYREIYRIENETCTNKVVPIKERVGLMNRNTTNGEFGIWGHDIENLVIEELHYYPQTHELGMFIGS